MPSGWDVYYVVFLSAFLALGIPAFLALVSSLVSPGARSRKTFMPTRGEETAPASPGELNRTEIGERMNARFFLAANAALILIALALALIPCAGTLQPGGARSGLLRGLVAIVSISAFAALGLLYSARKGDLSWLRTFQPGERGTARTPKGEDAK